jgi:hypothetical protein
MKNIKSDEHMIKLDEQLDELSYFYLRQQF